MSIKGHDNGEKSTRVLARVAIQIAFYIPKRSHPPTGYKTTSYTSTGGVGLHIDRQMMS